VSTTASYGQYNVDYGFAVGGASYLGDIGGGADTRKDFVSDMKLSSSRWTLGGFFRYRIGSKLAVKASLNYIRLTGDDAKTENPPRRARNLNFKNDMYEFLVNGELYLYKVNDVGGRGTYSADFNLYAFVGVGLFYSNPKGETSTGEWVSLQPLQTEGVTYSKFNFALPVGLGFYYTLSRKYRVGLEIGWRTTFTDYIDDVSTVYANDYDGISNKTSPALLNEINAENGFEPGDKGYISVNNFDAGSKRGDPSHNDSYMTATLNFSMAIRGRSKFYRSRHSWVLGKNKRRRRKSRAKF
jgi:hypothetical protein